MLRRLNGCPLLGIAIVRSNVRYVGVSSLIRGRAFRGMEETLESLQHKMEEAARALDFEEAKRCRDRISLMRSGASAVDAAQADFAGLERQQPGAMGLGTSQPRIQPPPGWKPPRKPDPMTARSSSRGKK